MIKLVDDMNEEGKQAQELKFCKDCKWFKPYNILFLWAPTFVLIPLILKDRIGFAKCENPNLPANEDETFRADIDLVSGKQKIKKIPARFMQCRDARKLESQCGIDAKYFELK